MYSSYHYHYYYQQKLNPKTLNFVTTWIDPGNSDNNGDNDDNDGSGSSSGSSSITSGMILVYVSGLPRFIMVSSMLSDWS